ncbi:DUF2264 domain-containing protein [Pleomorphomonas carboxyditropha]|uniref:DUF2264 domain-containing protein n=1 Tax=Pleomorphomonas carboxyditropha TaxID=2023338 RepID=A0A2G9WP15_9HYPH|nr:DUF2264 domain-containing protein [Pleomorphomonas carboxyditropha]PIO96404.1 hypothetical protein CJ014_25505 [Pleomorphomonas carboxyditropha]
MHRTHLRGFSDNPLVSRSDFQQAARCLIAPLVPHVRAQGAALDLEEGAANFDMRASSLEGVARPFWGLAPLLAGGGAFADWPIFIEALRQGTDPAHPHYWGAIGDLDQRSVEAAAVGFLLALVPGHSWDLLAQPEQDRLATWLAGIQSKRMSDNNWLYFPVLAQAGLRRVGRGDLVDDALERRSLDRLASWYLGDGWYGDGGSGAVDHYGAFAMHFYGLLRAVLSGGDEFSALARRRAAAFAAPFSHWFAENGEALAVGRSLVYRFATSAFWGLLAVAGEAPLPLGVVKGLWARQIRCWRDKPVFTPDGILSRGSGYPNLQVCETYNSPTSPYWAMKAFLPLMLAEDHPFWRVEEEPLQKRTPIRAMPANRTLVQHVDGHSIVHYAAPIHRWLQIDKYNKFAYSTLCGFDVGALQYAANGVFGDNILAFSFDGGANWQMRLANGEAEITADRLGVDWTTGAQRVLTEIEPVGEGLFVRRHRFHLDRPAVVVETGFAVNEWHRDASRVDAGGTTPAVVLTGENAVSGILSLDGHPRSLFDCARINSNTACPRTRVPGLRLELAAGEHTITHGFWLAERSGDDRLAAFLDLRRSQVR